MPKVRALTDKAKKLWHVPGGFRFNDQGISDWPYDQFTKRRIRDGDIELVDKPQQQGHHAQHAQHAQHADQQQKRVVERKVPAQSPQQQSS